MNNMSGIASLAAAGVFGASALVFGATVVGAVRTEDPHVPAETAGPPGMESSAGLPSFGEDPAQDESPGPAQDEGAGSAQTLPAPSPRGPVYPRVSNNELLEAVNQDIFQPDRTPRLQRYLLPSERAAPVQASRNDRRQREPNLRIVGTAIAGDFAIAMVQPEDSIPFAVLVGEVVDGFTLAAVTEEMVILSRDGTDFTLPVVEPQRGRSSNDNRDRDTRNNNASEEVTRALTERVQQMLQGAGRGQMGRGGVGLTEAPVFRIQIPGGGQPTAPGGRPGGGAGSEGSQP